MHQEAVSAALAVLCLTCQFHVDHAYGSSVMNLSSYSHRSEPIGVIQNTSDLTLPSTKHQHNRNHTQSSAYTNTTKTTVFSSDVYADGSSGRNHSYAGGHGHHPIRHHRNHREGRSGINSTNMSSIPGGSNSSSEDDSNRSCITDSTRSQVSEAQLSKNIDQFVTRMLNCHRSTTAMTLAVVKGGRTILTKGYGRSNVRKGKPVTSRTRFAIGSLTKAFTATVVVQWLHQNNKSVDTPIQSFYPSFRVTDELRSRMATFQDLLAHRMGIPGNFKPLLVGFPKGLTRAQFVRAMADMPTWLSFRDKFSYNNYMYTIAAHVIEKMSRDKTWEELVRDQLLIPLNMTDTGFFMEPMSGTSGNDMSNVTMNNTSSKQSPEGFHLSDFAHGCAKLNGALEDVSPKLWLSIVPCGPAGAIYSNAEDMAKWMNFQLSKGQGPHGDLVVDPEVLSTTWKPSMLTFGPAKKQLRPAAPVGHVTYGYGLGWVSAVYRGFNHLFHTGGYLTHSSRLWLFQDLNAGIYLTVNGPQTRKRKANLIKSVMYYAADELLGEPHWFNSCSACKSFPDFTPNPSNLTSSHKMKTKKSKNYSNLDIPTGSQQFSNRNNTTGNQSLFICSDCPHISFFVGTYKHKCFGKIQISLTPGNASEKRLVYRFGRFGQATFSRISALSFEGKYDGALQIFNKPGKASETLLFSQNEIGHIDSLQYLLEGKDKWTTFKRMSDEPEQPRIHAVKTRAVDDETSRDVGSCLQSDKIVTVLAVCLKIFVSFTICQLTI
ncbi:penicillin-binding protein 4-like isoform X1 [Elysia marginata]|uniref:Penicillin-binding protein 4-like isoform X1 n=1 Tax=Elysia marginata TaxID=1093978 RepID=A0AAV4FLA2_9GAST|nr:penicillin-binding protein 4-like isoform X1 [Elysia marginata]